MKCTFPVRIDEAVIRCGRCRACRIYRKSCWQARAVVEASAHPVSTFLTLTYRDDPGQLQYRDVQLFLKAMRQSRRFRFICVGEYGERLGRGHWHLLGFGLDVGFEGLGALPEWSHGHVFAGDVTPASAGYVCGYTLKNVTEGRLNVFQSSRRPGIGLGRVYQLGVDAALAGSRPAVGLHVGRSFLPFDAAMRQRFDDGYVSAGGQARDDRGYRLGSLLLYDGGLVHSGALDRMIGHARQEVLNEQKENGETPGYSAWVEASVQALARGARSWSHLSVATSPEEGADPDGGPQIPEAGSASSGQADASR